MTGIEQIVLAITIVGLIITFEKLHTKRTRWVWNFGPFILGFTTCLWIARIFG